ncbi:hypothetical protein ACX0G9_22170 [Flavitalea flava]
MTQMQVDDSLVIYINYDAGGWPQSFKEFRPVLYQEGNLFCCLLGPDQKIGIFGCGETKEEAIKDWDCDFNRRIKLAESHTHNINNEVTQFLLDSLATHKKDVW